MDKTQLNIFDIIPVSGAKTIGHVSPKIDRLPVPQSIEKEVSLPIEKFPVGTKVRSSTSCVDRIGIVTGTEIYAGITLVSVRFSEDFPAYPCSVFTLSIVEEVANV